MKTNKVVMKSVLVLAALMLMVHPSFAATANLAAVRAEWMPPGGIVPVPMWGFVNDTGSCPAPADPPVSWTAGPTIEALPGDTTLTVNLRNCLSEPVSVFIPGQYKTLAPVKFTDAQSRERVRSFDMETAPGAVGVYDWSSLKEGTYLYHSGTHPQVQVQMGLYGALVVNGTGYPAAARDAVLLYSEIDPALHAAVDSGAYGTPAYPSTFNYQPKYFLINGLAYPETVNIAADANEDVLLRFVNAGLKTHVPTIQNLYMNVIAEDGNLYQYPMQQYSVQLTAAKTMDAIVNTGTFGTTHALYDRSLHLTNAAATGGGMLTYLVVAAAEICNDLIDNDGDGLADCADPDCAGQPCEDGIYCNGIDTCGSGSCSIHSGDPCAFCNASGCICNETMDSCMGCNSDDDCDGVCNPGESSPSCSGSDNCSVIANGSLLGTCVSTVTNITLSYWAGSPPHHIICTSDTVCSASGGTCQLEQGDGNGNGVGDACECYADCNRDTRVNLTDLVIMKGEFFRADCDTNPCQADSNGDNQVNLSDLVIMKIQYFRTGCPVIP